eukprot:scaffold14295_cov161-Skeletonema_marinoi.AAC.8
MRHLACYGKWGHSPELVQLPRASQLHRTTVHHDFSASQATAQGTTEVEEKMEIKEQTLVGDK